jgi:hypothetical protein
MTRSPPRRFPGPVRTPGFVGGVKAAALLLGVAGAALVWAPWHGAVVLSVSASHGIDVEDLPALALVALSVAILHARAKARNTPTGLSWLAGRWTAPASAVVLGALLLLVGPVDTYSQWSLVPAGGGTFNGSTQHADGRRADPLDRWTHVALTYDMKALRLYVDGTEASHRAMTGRTLRTTDPLWIGGNRPFGEYFQGVIDEVRVYDRALRPSEVRAAMSTPLADGATSRESGLVGAYGFNAGSGTVVTDASGKGNAGAIRGATWTTAGRFGGGMRFDHEGEVVRVPASASLDLSGPMTLSAWIRPSESQSGWRTILHRQTDAYFLTAGGGRGRENRLGTLDDARVALVVLAAVWFCLALVLGPARWVGERRPSWWLPIALFLAGSVVDAALAPAGTLVGPTLVAIWCARIASHRGERAIFYLIAAAFTAVTVVSLAGPDGNLTNDGDATARSMAVGLLLVIIGLLGARHGRAALRSTRTG